MSTTTYTPFCLVPGTKLAAFTANSMFPFQVALPSPSCPDRTTPSTEISLEEAYEAIEQSQTDEFDLPSFEYVDELLKNEAEHETIANSDGIATEVQLPVIDQAGCKSLQHARLASRRKRITALPVCDWIWVTSILCFETLAFALILGN